MHYFYGIVLTSYLNNSFNILLAKVYFCKIIKLMIKLPIYIEIFKPILRRKSSLVNVTYLIINIFIIFII